MTLGKSFDPYVSTNFFNMVLRLLAAAAALGTASAQCSSYMEVNQVRSKAAVSNLLVSAPLDSARLCSARLTAWDQPRAPLA